jgi:hypothetical protein
MPQMRIEVSTSNPIEGCQSVAIAIGLVSGSSAKVCLYLMTNQSKHCWKTVLGSIIRSCSQSSLNAAGMRLRRVSISMVFMLTTLFCILSTIACKIFATARSLLVVQAVKIGHFIDIVREWVHVMWIRYAGGLMGVQGRVHCHVK